MTTDQIEACAAVLYKAQETRVASDKVSETFPGLGITGAYQVQRVNLQRRLRENPGLRLVGHKVGLTNEKIQTWLGVDEPDFGGLLSDMYIQDGGVLSPTRLIQPRAEGELAFVLAEDLRGPGVTPLDVLRATDFVLPAIEVVDSRVKDWNITIVDTVADNASSGVFVLGNVPMDPYELDMKLVGMTLRKNGRVAVTGAGAGCMGNPLYAVAWLANKLSDLGGGLKAGDIILSGALGAVVDLAAGDRVEVTIGSESVSFRVGREAS